MVNLMPENERPATIGSFMKFYFTDYLKNHPNKEALLIEFDEEKRSFLWNENGDFNQMN